MSFAFGNHHEFAPGSERLYREGRSSSPYAGSEKLLIHTSKILLIHTSKILPGLVCISEEGSRVLIPRKTNPLDIISVTAGVNTPRKFCLK